MRKSDSRLRADQGRASGIKVAWDSIWEFVNLSPLGNHLWEERHAAKRYPAILGVAVILSLVGGWYLHKHFGRTDELYTGTTRLQILFPGGTELPRYVNDENVFRWNPFAYRADELHPDGSVTPRSSMIWTVLIVFDKPIAAGSMNFVAETSVVPRPTIESRDLSPRSAVIAINGDMPPGLLDLRYEPAKAHK